MKKRRWLILWGLASLIWLTAPIYCDVFGGERLLSCRDGLAMFVSVVIPMQPPYPNWIIKFTVLLLWFGPPIAVLLLVLAVKWIARGVRCAT